MAPRSRSGQGSEAVTFKEYIGYLWEDRKTIALAIVIVLIVLSFWE